MKKAVFSEKAPAAIGPYSQAIDTGELLIISGQIPFNQETGQISENIIEQTHQCMKNLQYILREAGLDFSNVVRCGLFLKDMNDFSAVNEVYASYLSKPYPARAAVEVARLPKDVLIEIEALAVKKK